MREMAEKAYKGGRTVTTPAQYRSRFSNFFKRLFMVTPALPDGERHRVE